MSRGQTRPLRPEGCLGRERELEVIAEGLDRAIAGRGGLFLVSGEPGVGKTTILEQVAAQAASRKIGALWARPREDRGAQALAPWIQILRTLVDEEGLASTPEPHGRLLRSLFPDLVAGDEPWPVPDEESRHLLFESVARLLDERAARQALVLLLEDLHAADLASLLLLRSLAEGVGERPILLVGSYRPADATRDSERSAMLARIARYGRPIALGGLGEPEVQRLIEASQERPAATGLAKRLCDLTGGNPLFVDGILRWHRAEGRALEPASLGGVGLPHEVREAIRRRLAVLSAPCRQALAAAAVLGREFEVPLLADLLGKSGLELLDVLQEATNGALLQDVTGSMNRRSFTHELVRATLEHDLPASERAQLHRSAGETMERAGNVEPRIAELAYHFVEGILAGSATPAVEYSRRAAEAAMHLAAYEEAEAHYERALEATDLEPSPDPRARCTLLSALGEACFFSGRQEAARAAVLRSAAIAEGIGADDELARAAILYRASYRSTPKDPAPVDLLRKARRALGPTPSGLRASLLAELASALVAVPGSEAERVELARQAIELAREVGDPARRAEVLFATHWATWGPDDLEGRIARLVELLDLGEEAGARRFTQACSWLYSQYLEAGDAESAEVVWGRWVRNAERYRVPFELWTVATARAMRALLEGRFEAGEALAEEAFRFGTDAGLPAVANFGLQQLVWRRERGGLAESVDTMEATAEVFADFPPWSCGLALVLAETGRIAEARLTLDRFAARDFRGVRSGFEALPSLWLLAETAVCLEDRFHAAELYDLLLPYAGQCALVHRTVWLGSIARPLGRIATLLGRYDEAARHFEEALAVDRKMGAAPAVAHGEAAFASLLDERAARGDAERATGLRASALGTARALGMTVLEERLEGRSARPPTPNVGLPVAEESFFRNEGDYWTIAYAGEVVRLRTTKGLQDLALLLQHPGVEFHAVQLAAGSRPLDAEPSTALGGDAGEVLDAQATAAYRGRLEDLRAEIAEAESFNDTGRVGRARSEMEAIAQQLAGAVGLGGRKRKASSSAERARIAVTKRIKMAIAKVADAHPALGRHLARSVRTGVFCTYAPDRDEPVAWS